MKWIFIGVIAVGVAACDGGTATENPCDVIDARSDGGMLPLTNVEQDVDVWRERLDDETSYYHLLADSLRETNRPDRYVKAAERIADELPIVSSEESLVSMQRELSKLMSWDEFLAAGTTIEDYIEKRC